MSKVGPAGPLEDGELGWFDPSDQPLALALLPITACWEIPAFLEFYGSEGVDGAARLMARLRSWKDRFGAEIVAHYGTTLEFAVPFPPPTYADALELAEAQIEIAECTTALSGLSVEDLAHLLVNRSTWFLHERP